jgi:hypothetical protein
MMVVVGAAPTQISLQRLVLVLLLLLLRHGLKKHDSPDSDQYLAKRLKKLQPARRATSRRGSEAARTRTSSIIDTAKTKAVGAKAVVTKAAEAAVVGDKGGGSSGGGLNGHRGGDEACMSAAVSGSEMTMSNLSRELRRIS